MVTPTLIQGLMSKVVVDIDAGCRHAGAITGISKSPQYPENGELFMWGFNMFHQTGNASHSKNQETPHLVKKIAEFEVKSVSCGYFHTCALAD